jgi:hypothetical protein
MHIQPYGRYIFSNFIKNACKYFEYIFSLLNFWWISLQIKLTKTRLTNYKYHNYVGNG